MKPTKVYIVTVGSYSDYRIAGVFLSKRDANRFQKAVVTSDESNIEEWSVGHPALRRDLHLYAVTIYDGTSSEVSYHGEVEPKTPAMSKGRLMKSTVESFTIDNVQARSREHAIKIANDQRAKAIVDGLVHRYWVDFEQGLKCYNWVEQHNKVIEGEAPPWLLRGEPSPQETGDKMLREITHDFKGGV